jgi:hypothetical protein
MMAEEGQDTSSEFLFVGFWLNQGKIWVYFVRIDIWIISTCDGKAEITT